MSEKTWKVDDFLSNGEKILSIIENLLARFQWVPADDPFKNLTTTTHKISLYLTDKRLMVVKTGKSNTGEIDLSVFSIIAIANLAERFVFPRSYQAQLYLPSGLILFIEIEKKDIVRLATETSRFLSQALQMFGSRKVESESMVAFIEAERSRQAKY